MGQDEPIDLKCKKNQKQTTSQSEAQDQVNFYNVQELYG